jgi:hypothetical protein
MAWSRKLNPQHLAAKHSPWPEAVTQIKHALEFERFSPEIRQRLHNLIEGLQPKSIADRLHLFVSIPEWEHEKAAAGKGYVDLSQKRAEKLADELAKQGRDWFEHIDLLFEGEQRQGLAFGQRLGRTIQNPLPFIDAVLSVLREITGQRRNVVVLSGFLGGISDIMVGRLSRVLIARQLYF